MEGYDQEREKVETVAPNRPPLAHLQPSHIVTKPNSNWAHPVRIVPPPAFPKVKDSPENLQLHTPSSLCLPAGPLETIGVTVSIRLVTPFSDVQKGIIPEAKLIIAKRPPKEIVLTTIKATVVQPCGRVFSS